MFDRNNVSFLQTSWGRSFIVTLVFVTLASGLFWLEAFRGYEAETDVLVIGRSASIDGAEAAADLAELMKTLAFYDRMLAENDMIGDRFAGQTSARRKTLWNETIAVSQNGTSGMFSVRVRSDDPETARLLARQAVRTLASAAGFYYDVRADIDLRIVDGPIVTAGVRHPFAYAAASLGTALALTAVFFFILRSVPAILARRESGETWSISGNEHRQERPAYSIGETVPFIDPRKFIPEKPVALSYDTPRTEEKKQDVPRTTHAKAPAPDNLPVGEAVPNLPVADEESLPFQFEEPEAPEEEVFPAPDEQAAAEDQHPTQKKTGEPTVEDYKRRLNELLAGGK